MVAVQLTLILEVPLLRFPVILLLILFLAVAVIAKEEDTGVEPGLNIDFNGGETLNKIGASLGFTYPLSEDFTFRLTLNQNVQNEPESKRKTESRTLRFDLFYQPVEETRLSCYYEQADYSSDRETQDQYEHSTSHKAGTSAFVQFSKAFTIDFDSYFTLTDKQEGTYDFDYGYRDFVYESLSANANLKLNYQISDDTRLNLDLTGSREVRDYPTQPALDSEYYVGGISSSVTGNYNPWENTNLELRYLFSGTLYRDIYLIERDQNTMNNSLSMVANYLSPFDVSGILSVDLTHGTTTYMEKDYYLQKYYYRIYPELDPVPDNRLRTPWWPLYDILSRGINWKVQLNWDSPREEYLHWTLSQDTSNRRYFDDKGELPPDRFAIASSVLTNIKNTMSTDAQINLGKSFILKLQHKITHDDYSYPISPSQDSISIYNDVSSSIRWKLTNAVSFNSSFSVGFDRTTGGVSITMPRSNDIKLSFGSEVKLVEGLRVGLTYTLSRNNRRTDDFKSGSDSLSRKLTVEPVFSISDYWGLDFSGSFSESATFSVGESIESSWLRNVWRMSSKLNIYPTETLAFELTYKLNFNTTTITGDSRTDYSWGLSFSYNIIEDLVVIVNADYRVYEYDYYDDSFNVGLRIRTNL